MLSPAHQFPSLVNNIVVSPDSVGQIPPPGVKPRVTTTLWEDEGTLCFQVEANGFSVARREDNNMINGTKLLNVAGMTRGRRDGILKAEKVRHVVKIGTMYLKGVWIPYERALEFCQREQIVDILYPLFVADIRSFLYHPINYNQTIQVLAAAERKKQAQQYHLQHTGNFASSTSYSPNQLPSSNPSSSPSSALTSPINPHHFQNHPQSHPVAVQNQVWLPVQPNYYHSSYPTPSNVLPNSHSWPAAPSISYHNQMISPISPVHPQASNVASTLYQQQPPPHTAIPCNSTPM